MLISYPLVLLKALIRSESFLGKSLESLMHKIISSEGGIIWFLPSLSISFLSFFLPYCSKIPSTVLTKAKSGHFVLYPDFRGNPFSRILTTTGCYIETLLCWGIVVLFLLSSEHLLWRDSEFYHRFLCIYWDDHMVSVLESMCCTKFTNLYALLTLEWSRDGHGVCPSLYSVWFVC